MLKITFDNVVKNILEKKWISLLNENLYTGLWICLILVVRVFVKMATGSVNGAQSIGWGYGTPQLP